MRRHIRAIIIALILILLVLPMGVTIFLYESYFGKRAESTADETTLTLEDFPDLSRTELTFTSGSNTLTGYLYYIDNTVITKGMVVFSHGIWSNHLQFLEQIEYFVENGYLVFAYDNTGTADSEGDSLVGLVQSQLDLDAALDFLEESDSFHDIDKVLYGYSWGAYAVTSVLNNDHDVKAVVAMAPFNRSVDMLLETGSSMYGDWLYVLKPYMMVWEFLKFGFASTNTGLSGVNSTDIPVLIYHSDDDETISLDSSLYAKQDRMTNENVQCTLVSGRNHTPFLTDEAVAYREEYAQQIANGEDAECDKDLYYQLDEDIMAQILEVFDSVVEPLDLE